MSYVAPSGTTVTINSGQNVVSSGIIEIELIMSASSSQSLSMDVLDYGSVEVDYDYVESVSDVNDFKINVPVFEFTVFDRLSDDARLIEFITALSTLDVIAVKHTYTPNGGSAFTEYYYATRDSCEYDFLKREVKIEAKHPLKYNLPAPGQVWNSSLFSGKFVDAEIGDPGLSVTATNAFLPKDLIRLFLQATSGSQTLNAYGSQIYTSDSSSSFQNGEDQFLFIGESSEFIIGDLAEASTAIKGLALSEAALVGNVMGYTFFMPRYDNTQSVTLTAHDFEELGTDISFKDVRNFRLNNVFDPNTYGFGFDTGQIIFNEFGANDIEINYNSGIQHLVGAQYFLDTTVPINQTAFYYNSPSYRYNSLPSGVQSLITDAYRRIFRIGATTGIYLTGKILGVDTLKPYEHFSVASGSIDPLVDGRRFRPSYLKYDLVKNIIEFEAYQF